MRTVAVLCCAFKTPYKALPAVECFDRHLDVRTFAGGKPVVAHPPCRAWSVYTAHQSKPDPGEKELGPICVDHLRAEGGVLEHPAHSRLFVHCGLPAPGRGPGRDGLWTMEVWQAWWGYAMRKKTWLCFAGLGPEDIHLPFALHAAGGDRRREQIMSHAQRSATLPAFAVWLVTTARTSRKP